tara:strand:- start:120 stop:362 length:243 start_codon:yes stop_codon:yes gene_type:complete
MEEYKKSYQRNYYINRRDHILSLANKPRQELNEKERFDVDKFIKRFRPKTARILRTAKSNHDKGKKEFKIEHRHVVVCFN